MVQFESQDGSRILVNPAHVKSIVAAEQNLVGMFALVMEFFPLVDQRGELRVFQHAIVVRGETFATLKAKLGVAFEIGDLPNITMVRE